MQKFVYTGYFSPLYTSCIGCVVQVDLPEREHVLGMWITGPDAGASSKFYINNLFPVEVQICLE